MDVAVEGPPTTSMLELHLALVALLVGTQAFFTALAVWNLRYSDRTIEAERDWLRDRFDIEDPHRLREYLRLSTGLGHLRAWIGLVVVLLVLYSGLFGEAVLAVEALGFGPIATGTAFFVLAAVSLVAFGLPFDAISTFVVDEIFDFNQQTIRLWVRDALVSTAITVVIVGVLAGTLLWFVGLLGWWWWVAGWAAFVVFILAMNVLYPRVIAPLFNTFEPVEKNDLRTAVEDVFDRAGFECSQIYTMDASRRSSRANAYFVGFGRTKRVVLFDTLVDRLDREAIQSVLAHELAHWKRAHVWKGLAVESLYMGAIFALVGALVGSRWVYGMFDLDPGIAHAGIVLALVWVGPVVRLTSPITNRVWLRFEREADRFAVDVMGSGEGLIRALTGLTRENLSNPFPHPWHEAFHARHPSVPDRIRAIQAHGSAGGEPVGARDEANI